MNIDTVLYNNLLQAAHRVLQNNLQRVGRAFADGFINDFTLNNANNQNIQGFYNYVHNQVRQQNGNDIITGNDQLFNIVGAFVNIVFNQWTQRQQQMNNQQSGFNSFNPQPMGFGNNSGFGGGSMFPNASMGMGNRRPEPSSYLSDNGGNSSPTPTPTTTVAPVVSSTGAAAPTASMAFTAKPSVSYVSNPLDDLPEAGIEFVKVKGKGGWNGDKAKDNRIIIAEGIDLKTRDSRFTVHATQGYHQEILNDPMQVMRDFYAIVPDSVLGSVFFYSIYYNHLDILDVPTSDFIEIRDKCIDAVNNDGEVLLHRALIDKLKTMQYGPYQALTQYLVKHINRALYLAGRLSDKPESFIKIGAFEDLNDLLNSSFRHSITLHPEGRHALETIVGNAIWNALVKNVGVMFEDGESIPTHAIQSSPVFPYSMEGVYPNKYAIPTSQDSDMSEFLDRLKTKELSQKTYLLSTRRVAITNVLNKKILPSLGSTPKLIATPIAPILLIAKCLQPYSDPSQFNSGKMRSVEPFASEQHPSDQFQQYIADPKTEYEGEVERYGRIPPMDLPVDQTIFAVQYGVDPMTYLEAVDVFTTIDDVKTQTAVVLATKDVPALHITR